jgi:Na+/H+ antiporter NhaD/arsenite permease-like protein
MNVGDKVIVTHDRTGHGIPLGKVVTIVSRCEYIAHVITRDRLVKIVETSDLKDIKPVPEDYELTCQERSYERFWLNFRLIGFVFVSVVLMILALVFFLEESHAFTNYLVGFVAMMASIGSALLGRQTKQEEELKILKEIQ